MILWLNNEKSEACRMLKREKEIYLFGAGYRTKKFLLMQTEGFLKLNDIKGILVSKLTGQEADIQKIPISKVDDADKDIPVFVALMETAQAEVCSILEKKGIEKIYVLTDNFYMDIIQKFTEFYLRKRKIFSNCIVKAETDRVYDQTVPLADEFMTYMVISDADQAVLEKPPIRKWETPIQAGAAISQQDLAKVKDNTGIHISAENKSYNELTVMYWIWKNTNWNYTGLCHYRRHFVKDDLWNCFQDGTTDVVLAMPDIFYDTLEEEYAISQNRAEYEIMLAAIKEKYPDYYDSALWCSKEHIFFPYNIFVAYRKIFEDYCEWIFTVIREMEQKFKMNKEYKVSRYFFSERLSTIYFFHNRERYNIKFEAVKWYR